MKMNKEEATQIEIRLDKISNLLEESLEIYKIDRDLAQRNYNSLKQQLDSLISDGLEHSEEGVLEKQVNKALELLFRAGTRLDKAIEATTKILIAELNNAAKVKIAGKLTKGTRYIQGPADFKALTED